MGIDFVINFVNKVVKICAQLGWFRVGHRLSFVKKNFVFVLDEAEPRHGLGPGDLKRAMQVLAENESIWKMKFAVGASQGRSG